MYDMFTELINTPQKLQLAQRLAEIEAEDRDACAHCGGEDCICCPIYLDRQQWQSPEEFFSGPEWDDDYYYTENEDDFWFEEEII